MSNKIQRWINLPMDRRVLYEFYPEALLFGSYLGLNQRSSRARRMLRKYGERLGAV